MSDELKNLTVGEFLHTLRQVVAEKGANYSNGMCRYWHNGQPSCIIGHALDALGIVVPPSLEGKDAHGVLATFGATEAVQDVADQAQTAQDFGHTWGEALQEAEEAAELIAKGAATA